MCMYMYTEHTMEVEYTARKRISFTEFITLLRFLTKKVFMNVNQSVLNRFSTSGLNPPRPGS